MLLFVFYHDVDLELGWVAERLPAPGSTAQEKSLAGALSLAQKHKVPTGCEHPPLRGPLTSFTPFRSCRQK